MRRGRSPGARYLLLILLLLLAQVSLGEVEMVREEEQEGEEWQEARGVLAYTWHSALYWGQVLASTVHYLNVQIT